ncbi:topoisomerase II-associated protein PAT1 [Actinidia rufa]|uniref:Topoisomerase II-associated protein PAT1 n=1 Tax=Actinidia rufa TaxID=165716 RepID=A0A7J0H6A8_9ERIC|nr:topoisomerase II-associated protein PAT1 [Actinidia rufa]
MGTNLGRRSRASPRTLGTLSTPRQWSHPSSVDTQKLAGIPTMTRDIVMLARHGHDAQSKSGQLLSWAFRSSNLTVGEPFFGNSSGGRTYCCQCAAIKGSRQAWCTPTEVKGQDNLADGRSIAVMINNGPSGSTESDSEMPDNVDVDNESLGSLRAALEQESEGHSEDASQTLGNDDSISSSGVRQNAQAKYGIAQGESSDEEKARARGLLTSKLEFYNLEEGPIKLGDEEIQLSACPWERYLVGYFGGRFPGKLALNQIVASWKVCPSIQFHGSGWIIFQFSSRDDQEKVLENGPYMIYGSPLLLKQMDKYFSFGKEVISTFPVWVQLRSVPLTLWNPMIFGKICSRLGRPIHMDKLTTQKERVTYARCLVKVDMAKDLVHSVQLHTPEGDEHEKKIFYENLPNSADRSGGTSGATAVQVAETIVQGPKKATVQLTRVGGKSGALSTKEWVMKMAIHPKDNTISHPQSDNPGIEANSNIVPSKNLAGTSESPETEEDTTTPIYHCPVDIGLNVITDPSPGSTVSESLKKGHVSVPRRQGNAALPKAPNKASSSSIIPLAKAGARGKKKDKVNQGKGGKSTSFVDFYAEIGDDSPIPINDHLLSEHQRPEHASEIGRGIVRTKFVGWRVANNFSRYPNGRILILWKEELVQLDIIETTDQNSWILLGDFNNVLNNDERINGMPVTMYETREFKDCCYDLGLSDLRSSGMFHTWSNNKTWCKLDRAMVNTVWTQKGLSGQAHFDIPGIHSDHSPCTVSVLGENDRGATPLKFSICGQGTKSSRILVPELISRALKLAEAKASYCSKLAKAKYLKNYDRGSKFFHDLIKSRQTKSIISSITLDNGSRSNSSNQISEAFVQFYTSLLGTKKVCTSLNTEIVSRGRRLDSSQADNLTCPMTEEEIKKALFSIGEDKALGPDGFTSCFFKKAWTIVGGDFTAAVKEFFSLGQILRQINHSALALIPKFKDADKVEDFRPIACCNVIYKVILKIIALRFAPALISVVDPVQAAYVQNRKMVENIFLL